MRSSRWNAQGNIYLVTEEGPLTPEVVRTVVDDTDGILEVLVHHGPRAAAFTSLPKAIRGEQVPSPHIAELRGNRIRIEADPPHRLAYNWHTITPEWAAAVGMDEATAEVWRAELPSQVAFDIEDVGHGTVKLTVTHDGFAPGSAVLPAISEGWPAVFASLKTLLETGSSLRTA